MLLVIGEHERELIADRVTDVRRSLVEAGWPYGRVAFGYRLRPATPDEVRNGVARKLASGGAPQVFEPDPTTSGVAVEVFERVARGESVRSVSRWLAALPEGLRGGRAWPIQSVVDMLRSPTYIARPTVGAPNVLEREVARWQPRVSDDLWTRVQEQLESHQRRPHQASGNYLLTGFLRCDRCGSRMGASTTGYWNKGADAPGRVYRCIGGSLGANAPVRDCKHAVSLPGVDKAALEQVGHVLDTLADPDRWPAFQRAWGALDKPTDDAARVDQLGHEIAALNKRLANAAALLADGVLDSDGYQALRDRETAAIKDAEAELRRLAASRHTGARRLPSAQDVFKQVGSWAVALRGADVAVQREALDVLVEQVVPHRVSQRVYTVNITWTPLGQALAQAGNV